MATAAVWGRYFSTLILGKGRCPANRGITSICTLWVASAVMGMDTMPELFPHTAQLLLLSATVRTHRQTKNQSLKWCFEAKRNLWFYLHLKHWKNMLLDKKCLSIFQRYYNLHSFCFCLSVLWETPGDNPTSWRTFIHEFRGFEAVRVGLAVLCQLSLCRFSQSCYTHLESAEETGATVLLTGRRQDLCSHTVQRLRRTNRGYLCGNHACFLYNTTSLNQEHNIQLSLSKDMFKDVDIWAPDSTITAPLIKLFKQKNKINI